MQVIMRKIKFGQLLQAVILCIFSCCIPSGLAQLAVTTATLSGTVTDPAGAVIPHATVTLSSADVGVSHRMETDASGRYSFSQLPPSTYTLLIHVSGFEEYQQNGIILNAAQSATQNVLLTLGSDTQQIVVTGQASLLNTDNANISADIDSKQVVELPLNLRNVYGLATLNSSVNNTSEGQMLLGGGGPGTDNADQDISFLNFGGGFFGTSAYLLDGAWDTEPDWGAVVYVPSVDAVQEFKVQNNSFTAQYGWSTGNVINVTTKSGTSKFHGDAYEFYRNDALDANLWFNNHNNVPRGDFSRNQFGGSAGGPLSIPRLYKSNGKSFIFGLYERLTLSTPTNSTFTVPDANFLAGHFSELLGPQQGTDAEGRPIYLGQIYDPHSTHAITAGQVDPTTGLVATRTGYIRNPVANNDITTLGSFDPIAQKLISYYPKPNIPGISNNLFVPGTNPAHSNEYLVRIDHNISDASRFYVRYGYKEEFKTGIPDYWGTDNPAGQGVGKPNDRWDIAAGYSKIFTPTLTMNATLGVDLWHETSTNQSGGFKPSSLGLPSYLDTNSPEFPDVNIGGQSPLGPNQYQGEQNHGPIGTVAVDLVKLLGQHTMSFGFMGIEQQEDSHAIYQAALQSNGTFSGGPDPNNSTGFATGNGLAQFMLGVLDGGSAGISANPAVANKYLGWYFQDDWRPTRKLTVNMGIRYEIQTPFTYRHDAAAVFNPNVLNPISALVGGSYYGALQYLSSSNRYSYDPDYKNVAPRIGFSYQARPSLVFRGGYGIFYPPSILCCYVADQAGYSSTTPVPYSFDTISPNPAVSIANPWPNGYVPITGNSLGEMEMVGYGVGSNFRNRPSAYVQQYLAGVQWAITANDSLDVNYVGNHGIHMSEGGFNHSQVDPKYLSMGESALNALVTNPFYGHIDPGAPCALGQQQITESQLLSPYPQYCGVGEEDAPIGFSNYNALQAAYNHRFSKGLTALVSYTYSKFLDNVEGNDSWAYSGNVSPANNYNLAAEKSVDGSDQPQAWWRTTFINSPLGAAVRLGGMSIGK